VKILKLKQQRRNIFDWLYISSNFVLNWTTLAFRGSSDTLFTAQNGNFRGNGKLAAILEEYISRTSMWPGWREALFVPFISRRVNKCHWQTDINVKYYSILLLSPDISLQQQLPAVLHFVHTIELDFEVKELLIIFEVFDTTGKGLCKMIQGPFTHWKPGTVWLSCPRLRQWGQCGMCTSRSVGNILRENTNALYDPYDR
jgi:hypothetical protein